jgi:hypothetical protein
MKFIKRLLKRSWNIIKYPWEDLFIDFIIKSDDLTTIGKYVFGFMFCIMLIIYSIFVTLIMPILLISVKYDETIGI